jgi:hypothetical protein
MPQAYQQQQNLSNWASASIANPEADIILAVIE